MRYHTGALRYLSDDIVARLRGDPDASVDPDETADTEAPAQRFEMQERIGAGGMGEVYRALDKKTGRTVAMKLVSIFGAEEYARFRREASALVALAHPAIVRYVAHGVYGERVYLAMDWLDGEVLESRLYRQGLTLLETVALGHRIAAALAAAHDEGIVHRDVKPGNIVLLGGEPERAVLIDFGIARSFLSESSVTAPGFTVGTPGYMAPEQARAAEWIDPRADVFALGCVLYKCLTGRRPFRGTDPLVALAKTLLHEPPSPGQLRRVPPEIDRLVMRMLAKDPEARPADGSEVARALLGFDPTDDGRVAPLSADYPRVGKSERRLSSLLLIGGLRAASRAGLPSPATKRPEWSRMTQAALENRVALAPLADGSIVVHVSEPVSVGESLRRLACAGLALGPFVPQSPMVLVTVRGTVKKGEPSSAAIESAAGLLSELRGRGEPQGSVRVRVDGLSERLLGERFSFRRGWLVGEGDSEPPTLDVALPKLHGRDAEVSELARHFSASCRHHEPRFVLVTGPMGIGKTRLAEELVRRALTSIPIPAVLRLRAGTGSVSGLAGRLLAAAGTKVDVAPDEPLDQALIERLVSVVRRQGPLIVVVDGLCSSDAEAFRLLAALTSAASASPLYLLALARTAPPDWEWALNVPGLSRIELGPLARPDALELVRGTSSSAADDALDTLLDLAEGNPLALLELSRAEDRERAPETVLAIGEPRFAELSPEHRRVLRAASVFGLRFSPDAAETLVHDLDVHGSCDELVHRGVLVRSVATSPGRSELAFASPILREVAHASLTDEDRTVGHRSAAEWLSGTPSADPTTLASHFRLGARPRKAYAILAKLARDARRGSDFGAVVKHARQAIECGRVSDPEVPRAELVELHLLLAESRRLRGELEPALASAEQGLALSEPSDDAWYEAVGEVCDAAGELARIDRVVEALESVPARPRPEHRGARLLVLCRGVGHLLERGHSNLASRWLEELIDSTTPVDVDDLASARFERLRGLLASSAGDFAGARRHHEQAEAVFRRLGSSAEAAAEQLRGARACLALGDRASAKLELEQAKWAAEFLGLPLLAERARRIMARELGP